MYKGILAVVATSLFFIYTNLVAAQVVTNGLVSYWSLNTAGLDGKTIEDVWDGNKGSISGNPEIVEGKIGKALEFDGDDHVDCGSDNSLLLGNTDLSLVVWFKQASLDGTNYIAGTYSTANGKYYELWAEQGKLLWSIDDNVVKSEISFTPIEVGQWYHAVGVREQGKEIRLYVNGVLEITGADQTGDIASDSPMFFGDRFAGERAFEGVIDEVGLYSRALSDGEILHNYGAKTGIISVEPAGKLSITWGGIRTFR